MIIDENTYAIPLFFSPTKQYCIFGSRNPLLIIINGTKVTSVPIGNIVIEQDSEIHVSWLDNVTFLLTNKHTQGAFERNYIGNVDDIEKNKMRIQLNPIWENEKNRNFHVLDYEGILDYEDRGDQAARFIFHAISGYEDRTYCTNGSPMVDDLFPNDILFPLSMEYMILLQDLEQSIKESPASVKSAFKELKNYPENEVDFFEGFFVELHKMYEHIAIYGCLPNRISPIIDENFLWGNFVSAESIQRSVVSKANQYMSFLRRTSRRSFIDQHIIDGAHALQASAHTLFKRTKKRPMSVSWKVPQLHHYLAQFI